MHHCSVKTILYSYVHILVYFLSSVWQTLSQVTLPDAHKQMDTWYEVPNISVFLIWPLLKPSPPFWSPFDIFSLALHASSLLGVPHSSYIVSLWGLWNCCTLSCYVMPSSLFLNPTPETSSRARHLCSFLALGLLLCSSSRSCSLASCPHFPPSASLISDGSPSLQDSWFSKCLMMSDSCPLHFPSQLNPTFQVYLDEYFLWILRNLKNVWKKIANFEPLRFRQSSYDPKQLGCVKHPSEVGGGSSIYCVLYHIKGMDIRLWWMMDLCLWLIFWLQALYG